MVGYRATVVEVGGLLRVGTGLLSGLGLQWQGWLKVGLRSRPQQLPWGDPLSSDRNWVHELDYVQGAAHWAPGFRSVLSLAWRLVFVLTQWRLGLVRCVWLAPTLGPCEIAVSLTCVI
jgi:hypothetical protein